MDGKLIDGHRWGGTLCPKLFVGITAAMLFLSIFAVLHAGYLQISWQEILNILWSLVTNSSCDTCVPVHRDIILDLRLPRVLAAIPVGAGLALSGVILQTITRNNLADPYLFGVSGAGAFGGTLALIWLNVALGSVMFYACVIVSIVISLLILLQLVSYLRSTSPMYMILGGVALGYMWQGLQSYVLMYSPQATVYVWAWQNGGLTVATWSQIWAGMALVLALGAFFHGQYRVLNALAFDTESAIISGVEVTRYRLLSLLFCGLLIGLTVAIVGLISFVGLVVPHISRHIIGSSNHRWLIPGSMLLGGVALVWFDFCARMLGGVYEVSVNTVSSFFGALFFLLLLIKIYLGERTE